MLAVQSQCGAARHEHLETGRGGQQLAHDRRRIDDALEVVQHEHQRPLTQHFLHTLDGRAPLLADRQRVRNRRNDIAWIVERRQIDEDAAVPETAGELVRGRERQPGLPRPSWAGQRHQAHIRLPQESRHGGELELTPDEVRDRGG